MGRDFASLKNSGNLGVFCLTGGWAWRGLVGFELGSFFWPAGGGHCYKCFSDKQLQLPACLGIGFVLRFLGCWCGLFVRNRPSTGGFPLRFNFGDGD